MNERLMQIHSFGREEKDFELFKTYFYYFFAIYLMPFPPEREPVITHILNKLLIFQLWLVNACRALTDARIIYNVFAQSALEMDEINSLN